MKTLSRPEQGFRTKVHPLTPADDVTRPTGSPVTRPISPLYSPLHPSLTFVGHLPLLSSTHGGSGKIDLLGTEGQGRERESRGKTTSTWSGGRRGHETETTKRVRTVPTTQDDEFIVLLDSYFLLRTKWKVGETGVYGCP